LVVVVIAELRGGLGATLFPYTTLFRSRDLEKMGRGAVPQTVRVILELPSGQDVLSRAGWQAARRLRGRLAQDPRVSATLSFATRSEEHTSELQSRSDLVCRLLLEKKKN